MQIKRRRRLYLIIVLIAGVGTAVGFALYALNQNINLYYTPSQILDKNVPYNRTFRLGGMVEKGSVHRTPNSLKVAFMLTDFHQEVEVKYNGILPSLFRVGQGIVAQGKLNSKGVFVADQVLAKHDATYRPPGIGKAPSDKTFAAAK